MKYNKIIFDLDGVITSELMYWHAAALTVYELLFDNIDIEFCAKNTEMIYNTIFCDKRTVALAKRLGVNSNWDLALLVWCVAKHLGIHSFEATQFQKVYEFIEAANVKAPELYDHIYGLIDGVQRGTGEAWVKMVATFQHWYHGTNIYRRKYGEPKGAIGREGLAMREQPIVPLEELREKLERLKADGVVLGIGTGRLADEANYPLESWGIKKYFTPEHCVTYTDVEQAEAETGLTGELVKPNPFVFLKAAAGDRHTNQQIVEGQYDKSITEDVLIVGDAMADLIAAKSGGFKFAAVLTGAEAKKDYFEENGAEIIMETVLSV